MIRQKGTPFFVEKFQEKGEKNDYVTSKRCYHYLTDLVEIFSFFRYNLKKESREEIVHWKEKKQLNY